MAAKKVSIINMKGGVGKTTLSFHLGRHLAERERAKVLLIDLDPQANATILGTEETALVQHLKTKKSIVDLFLNTFKRYGPHSNKTPEALSLDDFIFNIYQSPTGNARFDLIPSEIELSLVLKGINVGPYDLKTHIINQADNRYDYILIDCAPTYSILTTLALNATESVLIPVMADSFAVYGVQLLKSILEEHKEDFGVDVKVIGLIFTMWESTNPAFQVQFENKIVKEWGLSTFQNKITKNNWYKVANGKRDPIWETPAHQPIKTEFDNFVTEFISKA